MASQEKVLIVEDEPHALSGLAELVSGWGYRTETARDGVEALEKVSAWQPGIVVTDLKMPRMDGLELLARLGESSEKIAVVMLTAQGSIELRGGSHEERRLRLYPEAGGSDAAAHDPC